MGVRRGASRSPLRNTRSQMSKSIVAAAAGLALSLLAAPAAQAKGAAANPDACTPPAALEHPFAPWADAGFYVLPPGGAFEAGGAGWPLPGGAAVVAGDDGLGVLAGASVLSVPAGATVVTAPICVDETFTHARLLVRALDAATSKLEVDVL